MNLYLPNELPCPPLPSCRKLDQITKATTVGGGIRQLEERLTDMTHRIHALAAKEEELISHIQESFVVYSAMTARLDEVGAPTHTASIRAYECSVWFCN